MLRVFITVLVWTFANPACGLFIATTIDTPHFHFSVMEWHLLTLEAFQHGFKPREDLFSIFPSNYLGPCVAVNPSR